MSFIKTKYYNLNRTVAILQEQGRNISLEDLNHYTSERIICPIIVIRSSRAFVCEGKDGGLIAIGRCYLSGYWNAGEDIIPIFNVLMKGKKAPAFAFIKPSDLIEYKIHSWEYDSSVFKSVPRDHIIPKAYSENLNIYCFQVLEEDNQIILDAPIKSIYYIYNSLNFRVYFN